MLVFRELNAGYWALRVAFGFGPLLAGLDKFTNILVNWEKYLYSLARVTEARESIVYVEHPGEFREAA